MWCFAIDKSMSSSQTNCTLTSENQGHFQLDMKTKSELCKKGKGEGKIKEQRKPRLSASQSYISIELSIAFLDEQ